MPRLRRNIVFEAVFGCWYLFVVSFFSAAWTSSDSRSSSISFRIKQADEIAGRAGFEKQRIETKGFALTAYIKNGGGSGLLTVYIEGDGYSWISRRRLSKNPTPKNPLALELAIRDTRAPVAYLGRPCQYISEKEDKNCNSEYWSGKRFSEEVIASMNEAVDVLKAQTSSEEIALIGYSGGGTVAAIIAAKRGDVSLLVTVAGNLDIEEHCKLHKITKLTGSLNPPDFGDGLRNTKQVHFIGSKDKVVPKEIVLSYKQKISPSPELFTIVELDGYGHETGWAQNWGSLLDKHLNVE